MICLRCGYCCHRYFVIIIDDPKKGAEENNLILHEGDGTPCKHLSGNEPGKYSCNIHSEKYYKETPCFSHGQIERSPNEECRIGRYILDKKLDFKKKE